jgi:hypothetical protein
MNQKKYSLRQIPKVPNYHNDGCGRDTYISFYNGGFGKYKLSHMYKHEQTESPRHYYHPNLALCKPTKRYFCNGGGRDSYVYISLLEENEKHKGNLKLNNILRSYDYKDHPMKTSKNISPSKFEKKLLNRIFYGKCPGLDERFMSPKVKFAKREESPKNEENQENEKNVENGENKEEFMKTRNSRYDKNYNTCLTEGNAGSKKNHLSNSVYRVKRTPKKYKLEIGESDNFMNSVKKIFLYNNSNNKGKNFYNNIKLVDYKNKRLNKEEIA